MWLFRKDINIEDLTFPDGEATEAKWVNIDEFIKMFNNNEIIPTVDFGREEYEEALENIYGKIALQKAINIIEQKEFYINRTLHPHYYNMLELFDKLEEKKSILGK